MPSTTTPDCSLGCATSATCQLAAVMRAQKQMIDGGGHRGIGEIAQPPRRLARIEKTCQIGKRDRKGDLALGLPQARHDLGIGQRLAGIGAFPGVTSLVDAGLQIGDQRLAESLNEHRRMRNSRVAQIRRERQCRDDKILERRFAGQQLGNVAAGSWPYP